MMTTFVALQRNFSSIRILIIFPNKLGEFPRYIWHLRMNNRASVTLATTELCISNMVCFVCELGFF